MNTTTKPNKTIATLRLTLDVTFVSDDDEPLDLHDLTENMSDIVRHAAGHGLMSQGTNATVEMYTHTVEEIK